MSMSMKEKEGNDNQNVGVQMIPLSSAPQHVADVFAFHRKLIGIVSLEPVHQVGPLDHGPVVQVKPTA